MEAYRATWGYNRLTLLICGAVLARFSAHAKARGLGTTNTRPMALAALHERPEKGQGVGPPRKIRDVEPLALTTQGRSIGQIARLRRLGTVSVWKRLARLKATGLSIPSPPSRKGAGRSRPTRRKGAP